jgi:hypothetical protein
MRAETGLAGEPVQLGGRTYGVFTVADELGLGGVLGGATKLMLDFPDLLLVLLLLLPLLLLLLLLMAVPFVDESAKANEPTDSSAPASATKATL